jgi:hypothetical protein
MTPIDADPFAQPRIAGRVTGFSSNTLRLNLPVVRVVV